MAARADPPARTRVRGTRRASHSGRHVCCASIPAGPSPPVSRWSIAFGRRISIPVICCWRSRPVSRTASRVPWHSRRRSRPVAAPALGMPPRARTRAARLASESGHPHAEGLSALAAGVLAFLAGEWKKASSLCERALVVLRDQCTGVTWEMNCAEIFFFGALLYQGEIGDVSRRLPPLLAAAKDRGNRFFETELRTTMNLVWLAADEPDEGERQANEAMEGWSHEGFHRQHYSHVLARIQTALYRGDAEAAWRVVGGQLADIGAHAALARPVPAHRSVVSAGARRAAQRGPRTRRRRASCRSHARTPGASGASGCAGRMRSRCCSARP